MNRFLKILIGVAISVVGFNALIPDVKAQTSNIKFNPGVVLIKPNDLTSKSVTINLTENPGASVTLQVKAAYSIDPPTGAKYVQFSSLTPSVTFTQSNYSKPQTISFKVDKKYSNGDFNLIVAEGTVNSKRFAGSFSVRISDSTIEGKNRGKVVFTPANFEVLPGDTSKRTASIVLSRDPEGEVTINAIQPSDDNGLIKLGKRTFIFNSLNYTTPQSFGITLNSGFKSSESAAIVLEGSNAKTYFAGALGFASPGNSLIYEPNYNVGQIDESQLPGPSADATTLNRFFARAVAIFTWLIAFVAFLSIIYSGFMYITSSGDAAKATQARKNIVWAIIGVIIAIAAYAIVTFVANINNFNFTAPSTSSTQNSTPTTNQSQNSDTGSGGDLGTPTNSNSSSDTSSDGSNPDQVTGNDGSSSDGASE